MQFHNHTQGMPTVILQVLFKKEETNHFCKRRQLTRLQSPFSINFCKLLFLVEIYFSISYLPFTLTIKLENLFLDIVA